MTRTATAGILVVLGALVACGGRPDGEVLQDPVQITASASVDGVPLLPGGATNSIQILIEGSMTTVHGIESSTYSWNGGDPIPLELNDAGAFSVNLDLVAGEGVLVLEGSPLVEGESSTLSMSFVLDQESPVLIPPDATFAAEIMGEGEMTVEKTSTSFTLSGGTAVPVVDGVSYSKYSSTYGSGQDNLPVWRFKLDDNLPLDDAALRFRVLLDATEIIAWTEAIQGEDGIWEVRITSDLNETLATQSGEYVLEVQAFDGAANATEIVTLGWTQFILSPPIYIAAGSEDVMGSPLGPRDPRSYLLGDNFADLATTSGLIVGSLVVGNPNAIPVLVQLQSTFNPRSSWGKRRGWTAMELDVAGPSIACGSESTDKTWFSYDSPGEYCQPDPWGYPRDSRSVSQQDLVNLDLAFEIRSVAGDVLSTLPAFVIPGNTEVHVMAVLNSPAFNLPIGMRDYAQYGPYWNDVTVINLEPFYRCDLPSLGCNQWDIARDNYRIRQYYAEWPFSARVESKVNQDFNDTTPWFPADPDETVGYSRIHISADDGAALPTGLNDITLQF